MITDDDDDDDDDVKSTYQLIIKITVFLRSTRNKNEFNEIICWIQGTRSLTTLKIIC